MDNREQFLKKLFANRHAKEDFENLVECGCNRQNLSNSLFSVSVLRRRSKKPKGTSAVNANWGVLLGLPEHKVQKFPARLHRLAEEIEQMNDTTVVSTVLSNPQLIEALPLKKRGFISALFQRFQMLPRLLHLYAAFLNENVSLQRKRFRPARFSLITLLEARLVEDVRDQTGSFHYAGVSRLLEASCYAANPTHKEIEETFSPAALAGRCRRFSAKFPRPKRVPRLPYEVLARIG